MKRFILIFVGLLCFTILSALPAYSDSLLQKAKSGNAEAQYYIGRAYYDGNGVKKDYNQAFQWFKSAAEKGITEAQYWMGNCYYEGKELNKIIMKPSAGINQQLNRDFQKLNTVLEIVIMRV